MNFKMKRVDPDIPILIAESNFTHRSDLNRNFEELFLKNLSVTGRGYRAVELCKRQEFRVIFVADSLVNLDGLQVIHSIREEGKNTSTPIVFLAEHQGDKLVKKASVLGASKSICKLEIEKSLRNVLEEILETQIITESEERARIQDAMKEAKKAVQIAKESRLNGDYELAQEGYVKGLVELYCGLAEICLSKGDKAIADDILKEAEKIDPEAGKHFEVREEIFVEQGSKWMKNKQFLGARSEFQAALIMNDKNVSAVLGLVDSLYGANELDEASRVIDEIMKAKWVPDDPDIFKQIGMTACRGKQFDLAHKVLNRAMKISPSDPKVLYCKAVAFAAAEEFAESVPYLKKALKIEPESMEAKALAKKLENWMEEENAVSKTLSELDIH